MANATSIADRMSSSPLQRSRPSSSVFSIDSLHLARWRTTRPYEMPAPRQARTALTPRRNPTEHSPPKSSSFMSIDTLVSAEASAETKYTPGNVVIFGSCGTLPTAGNRRQYAWACGMWNTSSIYGSGTSIAKSWWTQSPTTAVSRATTSSVDVPGAMCRVFSLTVSNRHHPSRPGTIQRVLLVHRYSQRVPSVRRPCTQIRLKISKFFFQSSPSDNGRL